MGADKAQSARDEPTHPALYAEGFAATCRAGSLTSAASCIFYGASTMLCTPSALAQEVGFALGAQAGEARMREVVTKAGFSQFRRATQTPFNIVFEARP